MEISCNGHAHSILYSFIHFDNSVRMLIVPSDGVVADFNALALDRDAYGDLRILLALNGGIGSM